ncbi:MAG TPA: CoA transferase, partial [Allosphingosinicella sp.]|nr:CoA transferase [Allosphingosinicella sp.]
MAKVLRDVRVLEMGTFITGPAAGMLLGDLGAEVIKIEHPEAGDPFRAFKGGLYSPHFQTYNRNKKSVTLNTKQAADLAELDRLVAGADVFIQNFRPGVAERLGVDAARLQAINPRLVYCAISGFGASGPDRDRPAFDTVAQAASGFLRLLVNPEHPRLVVKAGSIDEADDQRGLAHLLEHMAFNGSTNFKSGELIDFMESIGARFGAHLNAYTSFDETVYMLEVPTDREAVVVRGLQALTDFAGGIALETAEIDRERGVVIEEWRGRQGAASRMQDAELRAIFGNSRYADRVPIGLPETLKSFPADRLRDFYRDHYRPDRMAVIIVGDIDPDWMERQIRDQFGSLA